MTVEEGSEVRFGGWLKGAALVLGALSAAGFGAFAAGYALVDPGGWRGVAIVGGCALAMVLLGLLALLRPVRAGAVLAGLTVLAVGVAVADSFHVGFDRGVVGPVSAVVGLVVAVGVGCLGVRRPLLAGALLVASSLATFGVLLAAAWSGPDSPPVAAILTRSSGVGVVPMLLVGVLFLVAGLLGRSPAAPRPEARTPRRGRPSSPRPPAASVSLGTR